MLANNLTLNTNKITFKVTDLTAMVFKAMIILGLWYFSYLKYQSYQAEQAQTLAITSQPQINDIYFLDFSMFKAQFSAELKPLEKYRIAKVVDITGDTVTLRYGVFYYKQLSAAINSIRYGRLAFADYFAPKRYQYSHAELKNLHASSVISLAKRPVKDMLYGNSVSPEKVKYSASKLTYGKKENHKGEAFLKDKLSENNFELAFGLFQQSAQLGYPPGQVNLAKMYINGYLVKKDFDKALFWLKQASLQSYKPAILKYAIICKQVNNCYESDFYQELLESGVNIKVNKPMSFTLSNHPLSNNKDML